MNTKGILLIIEEKFKSIVSFLSTIVKYVFSFIVSFWKILLVVSIILNVFLLLFHSTFNVSMQQNQHQQATTSSETTVWNTVENSNLQIMIGDIKEQGKLIVTNEKVYKKNYVKYLEQLTPIEFATLKHINIDEDILLVVFLTHKKNMKRYKIKYKIQTNTFNTNYNNMYSTNFTLFQFIK